MLYLYVPHFGDFGQRYVGLDIKWVSVIQVFHLLQVTVSSSEESEDEVGGWQAEEVWRDAILRCGRVHAILLTQHLFTDFVLFFESLDSQRALPQHLDDKLVSEKHPPGVPTGLWL